MLEIVCNQVKIMENSTECVADTSGRSEGARLDELRMLNLMVISINLYISAVFIDYLDQCN